MLTFCLHSLAVQFGRFLSFPPPMEKTRSSAKERRLRQRRSDARVRLRLAADAVLLGHHHASDVPQQTAHLPFRGNKVAELLEQLVAQQGALFNVIASMSGWQAGMFHGPDFSPSTFTR